MGTILMLLIAALLESFFRQSEASRSTRYWVAGLSGLWWLIYFLLAGRKLKGDWSSSASSNY